MDLQYTRTARNRAAMRWVAGASSSGAFLGTVYGLIRPQPFDSRYLWLAGIALIGILATWLSIENQVACKDEIVKACKDEIEKALPSPRTFVRITIDEYEEHKARQAELDASLPYIVGGERTR